MKFSLKSFMEDVNDAVNEVQEEKNAQKKADEKAYKDKLAEIEKNASPEIKEIRNVYRGKKFRRLAHRLLSKNQIILGRLLVLIMIITPLLIGIYNIVDTYTFSDKQSIKYVGTEFDISMINNDGNIRLSYIPKHISLKICTNDKKNTTRFLELDDSIIKKLQTDINISDNKIKKGTETLEISNKIELDSFDYYNGFMYVTYKNNTDTALREFMISDGFSEDMSTKGYKYSGWRCRESKTEKNIKSYKNSYDDMLIYLSDKLLDGKLKDISMTDKINSIEKKLKYSELSSKKPEKLVLNFNEIGSININAIKDFDKSAGLYWSEEDNILKLYNYKKDKELVYITHIDNKVFNCRAEDLIETNYENLYITSDFDNKDSVGYRTFVLANGHSLYVFRVNKEANESVLVNLLNEFNIDRDKIKVKIVQSVIEKDAKQGE